MRQNRADFGRCASLEAPVNRNSSFRIHHSSFLLLLTLLWVLSAREILLTAQSRPPAEQIEAQVVTLLPHGFTPRKIVRPPGRFLLVVNNRSGSRQLSLRLQRAEGEPLRAASLPREQPHWRSLFDLAAGQYRLVDESRPGWVCEIVIDPARRPGVR